MEIKDLTGFSKPLGKLIDTIRGFAEPHLIKKNAEAKAYEIRQIASAINDARMLLGNAEYANEELALKSPTPEQLEMELLWERTQKRKIQQDLLEQINIEQITSHAAKELQSEETVSDEPVEPDWIKRFFDMAKDVSNEQMQILWGKILAGEVKQPSTYSIRTIEILRNISNDEAETFIKFANHAIRANNDIFVIYKHLPGDIDHITSLSLDDFLLMDEIGLISLSKDLQYNFPLDNEGKHVALVYGDKLLIIDRPRGHQSFFIHISKFTRAGKQLLNLVSPSPNFAYVQFLANFFNSYGAKIRYGDLIKIEGDKIHGDNLVEIASDN